MNLNILKRFSFNNSKKNIKYEVQKPKNNSNKNEINIRLNINNNIITQNLNTEIEKKEKIISSLIKEINEVKLKIKILKNNRKKINSAGHKNLNNNNSINNLNKNKLNNNDKNNNLKKFFSNIIKEKKSLSPKNYINNNLISKTKKNNNIQYEFNKNKKYKKNLIISTKNNFFLNTINNNNNENNLFNKLEKIKMQTNNLLINYYTKCLKKYSL